MLGSEAVARIKEGLGFLTGSHHDARILARLKEAQRDFEGGKSLPRFLLQEDQTLSLASGARTVALPTGFLRIYDDEKIYYLPADSTKPLFLVRKYFTDAALAYQTYREGSLITQPESAAPLVYVIRKSTIDFMTLADAAYTLYWSYYKRGTEITLGATNEWLTNATNWIIGEAGHRMAMDMRDADAIGIFQTLAQKGRAEVFGEIVAAEEADGPLQMGANL